MNELITYLETEKLLEERIQASPDEIAQWVFNGDLPAYTNNKFKGVQPFIFRSIDYVGSDDYLGAIYELWFKLADIEAFHPKQRYISRQALLDAGVRYLGDKAKALRVITSGINGGYLPEFHPIAGMVEIEGDLFRSGLFDVANVMEYPDIKDWLKVHADKASAVESVNTGALLSDSTKPGAAAIEPISQSKGDAEIGCFNVSGLLNNPRKMDDWFEAIDDMTKDFFHEYGKVPNQAQAWGRLHTVPPDGYKITVTKRDGKEYLEMPGSKPLSKDSFNRRWKKYTAKKPITDFEHQ